MERTMWTDERLDDLSQKVDAGFDRLDRDIRDLRMLMFQLWGTTMLGILATIGAVVATNT
ncbi:MAG TPA: hypothetical protein VEW07_01930 [Solirubrobacterales bacterium]|nr:hypothetical protein [Solirubrobacterales bacterium]